MKKKAFDIVSLSLLVSLCIPLEGLGPEQVDIVGQQAQEVAFVDSMAQILGQAYARAVLQNAEKADDAGVVAEPIDFDQFIAGYFDLLNQFSVYNFSQADKQEGGLVQVLLMECLGSAELNEFYKDSFHAGRFEAIVDKLNSYTILL